MITATSKRVSRLHSDLLKLLIKIFDFPWPFHARQSLQLSDGRKTSAFHAVHNHTPMYVWRWLNSVYIAAVNYKQKQKKLKMNNWSLIITSALIKEWSWIFRKIKYSLFLYYLMEKVTSFLTVLENNLLFLLIKAPPYNPNKRQLPRSAPMNCRRPTHPTRIAAFQWWLVVSVLRW